MCAKRNPTFCDIPFPEPELPFEHFDRPPAELDGAFLAILRPVLVAPPHTGLRNVERAPIPIVVANEERDLLRRAKADGPIMEGMSCDNASATAVTRPLAAFEEISLIIEIHFDE